MEKQQIGLTKKEWQLVLSALVVAQKSPNDNFYKLRRVIIELLAEGAPK